MGVLIIVGVRIRMGVFGNLLLFLLLLSVTSFLAFNTFSFAVTTCGIGGYRIVRSLERYSWRPRLQE